jgi:geranylgeranyl pyrophosphate synthase
MLIFRLARCKPYGLRCTTEKIFDTIGTFPGAAAFSSPSLASHPNTAPSSSWEKLIEKAEKLVDAESSSLSPTSWKSFSALEDDLLKDNFANFSSQLRKLVASNHPFLHTINQYYLSSAGKYLRPLLVLLLCKVLAPSRTPTSLECEKKCKNLAKISELIHTASLLHDDVLDHATVRRHQISANLLFGNKAAILSGDYLLSKASMELAKLENVQVVYVMSNIISDLVQGEFMQLESASALEDNSVSKSSLFDTLSNYFMSKFSIGAGETDFDKLFEGYLEKSFRKTASLIARSCEATAILMGASHEVQQACFQFGKKFGMIFQLVDDCLDFKEAPNSDGDVSGKGVGGQDLKNGILTAPFLYTLQQFPAQVRPLLMRQFSEPRDISKALELVATAKGTQKTLDFCLKLRDEALQHLDTISVSSPAKIILTDLTTALIYRAK